jgi:hypothetical protein
MSRAGEIYKNVLNAMQEAEEIEGVEGADYMNLMDMIIQEAQKRKNNCWELITNGNGCEFKFKTQEAV